MKKRACTQAEWDARCKQCGRCCYEKLEDGRGKIIYTDVPCEYLDVESNRCSVFETRFEVNPICVKLTPYLLKTLRWLPPDCGYRTPPQRFVRKESRTRGRRR